MGLLAAGETVTLTPLGGGVSCDVWRAGLRRGPVCVKRALPRLRVEAEWHAPAERAASEVAWLRLVAEIEPALVPRVLAEDRGRHLFVMEFLAPETHPVWKAELARDGKSPVEYLTAAKDRELVREHALTWLRNAPPTLEAIRSTWSQMMPA